MDGEIGPAHAVVRVEEPPHRDVGRSLEREDVRAEIPRHRQAPGGEVRHQRFLGQRRILVIVHEDVVEQGLVTRGQLSRAGGLRHEAGEVDLPGRGEDVEVATVEASELDPPPAASLRGRGQQLVGREQRFLRSLQELADLVGEAAELEHRPERRPVRGVLGSEQLGDASELVERGQRGRGRAIAEGSEAHRHRVVRQPVDGEDSGGRKRTPQASEDRVPRCDPGVPAPHDQGDPFRVRAALDQAGETLQEDRRLPGSRLAGHDHRPALVVEDEPL